MTRGSRVAALVEKPWFWLAVVGSISALALGRGVCTPLPPPLVVGGVVPPFSLVDQRGQRFESAQLEGRVWLAAVFSVGAAQAQVFGERVRMIQHRAHNLGTAFHVVCITDDPRSDSPDLLAAFVQRLHGSPRMWSFLTGDSADVERLLGGLRAVSDAGASSGAQVEAAALPAQSVAGASSGSALLIDPAMRIRARYDLSQDDTVEHVLRDVGMVANRGE